MGFRPLNDDHKAGYIEVSEPNEFDRGSNMMKASVVGMAGRNLLPAAGQEIQTHWVILPKMLPSLIVNSFNPWVTKIHTSFVQILIFMTILGETNQCLTP